MLLLWQKYCRSTKQTIRHICTIFSHITEGHVTRGNFPCNLQSNGVALHCKLQGRLPRVIPHVCNQSRNEKLRCKLQRKQKQLLLFAMLRDKLQRVTPPLQLVSQFFEKEPITIRHNQNAADIFKYSAGVKYNLIAGRKTSCVRRTS